MRQRSWLTGAIATVAILATSQGAVSRFLLPAPTAPVAHLKVTGVPTTARPSELAKLDGSLADVALRWRTGARFAPADLHAINPAARFRTGDGGRVPEVLVDAVTTGNGQTLREALQALGLKNSSVFANDVSGWLPIDQLTQAAGIKILRAMHASMPRTHAVGPVATQGDFAQRSLAARNLYPGLNGQGVTVGVLSDSFNCYAVYAQVGLNASGNNGYASNGFSSTYSDDQTTGALPSGINVLEEAPSVSGQKAGTCMDYGAPVELPDGDEGRAMLQIVHAIAPNAALAFHTAVNGEADFANGIAALAGAGAKVIADDLVYLDEPFFQDGIVAQAINSIASQGIVYFSAAGNNGNLAQEFTNPSFPSSVSIDPNVSTPERLLNFDPSGNTVTTSLPITVPALAPGEFVFLIVEWDQPYVTGAPASGGSQSAIDICVSNVSNGGALIGGITEPSAGTYGFQSATCTGPSTTGSDPIQLLMIGNPANAAGNTGIETLNVSIGVANGTTLPGRIKFYVAGNGLPISINQFFSGSPTIQGHANAVGAAAVGAAFYFQTPACGTTPAVLESFSSVGGDPILFSSSGARLASPELRQKPDFVGPDGVNDTFLGFTLASANITLSTPIAACQNHAGTPSFFGTSAATPHAAAAAALMLQANPALTPSAILNALRSTAAPMGAVPNATSGYGFLQIDLALAAIPTQAPTVSLSASTITVGSSTTLSWSAIGSSSCAASGSWSGTQAPSGTQTLTPATAGSYTYTLACTGANGSLQSASATLNVTAAASSGSGKSGGGALDIATLLALSALAFLRHRHPRR